MAMARRVAAGLHEHPARITLARDNRSRWRVRNADAPALERCYNEWSAILDRGVDGVIAVLLDPSDEAQRLRQNSPFVGVLTPREVWEIKRACREDQSAAEARADSIPPRQPAFALSPPLPASRRAYICPVHSGLSGLPRVTGGTDDQGVHWRDERG
jgi:hypothetical protein